MAFLLLCACVVYIEYKLAMFTERPRIGYCAANRLSRLDNLHANAHIGDAFLTVATLGCAPMRIDYRMAHALLLVIQIG